MLGGEALVDWQKVWTEIRWRQPQLEEKANAQSTQSAPVDQKLQVLHLACRLFWRERQDLPGLQVFTHDFPQTSLRQRTGQRAVGLPIRRVDRKSPPKAPQETLRASKPHHGHHQSADKRQHYDAGPKLIRHRCHTEQRYKLHGDARCTDAALGARAAWWETKWHGGGYLVARVTCLPASMLFIGSECKIIKRTRTTGSFRLAGQRSAATAPHERSWQLSLEGIQAHKSAAQRANLQHGPAQPTGTAKNFWCTRPIKRSNGSSMILNN